MLDFAGGSGADISHFDDAQKSLRMLAPLSKGHTQCSTALTENDNKR